MKVFHCNLQVSQFRLNQHTGEACVAVAAKGTVSEVGLDPHPLTSVQSDHNVGGARRGPHAEGRPDLLALQQNLEARALLGRLDALGVPVGPAGGHEEVGGGQRGGEHARGHVIAAARVGQHLVQHQRLVPGH